MVRLNEIKMQDGKVFLITGANSGLGYETSKFLLERGATVIMSCRDLIKGEKAKQELLKFNFSGKIELVELDLSDLINVKKFAESIKNKFDYLDVLINNAGIMAPPKTLSKQGFEIQFAVNHLAHMFLTLELLPMLEEKNNSNANTPIAVKISPDLSSNQVEKISQILIDNKIETIIISNSTDRNREGLTNMNRFEKGGLSGKPIEKISNRIIIIIMELS